MWNRTSLSLLLSFMRFIVQLFLAGYSVMIGFGSLASITSIVQVVFSTTSVLKGLGVVSSQVTNCTVYYVTIQ